MVALVTLHAIRYPWRRLPKNHVSATQRVARTILAQSQFVLMLVALTCVTEQCIAQKASITMAQAQGGPPPLDIEPTMTPSGLEFIDVVVGSGPEARSGQQVTVHYTGWLTNAPNSTPRLIEANHSLLRYPKEASLMDGS